LKTSWKVRQQQALSVSLENLTFFLELIGEEIYDEFDPQGARADLSSYAAPAEPSTTVNSEESSVASTVVASSEKNLTPSHALKTPTLKGFSFLHPKSTPNPPDAQTDTTPDGSPVHNGGDAANPALTESLGLLPLGQLIYEPSQVNSPGGEPLTARIHSHDLSKSALPVPAHVVGMPTCSASPAPSLEAILLDRKRRLNATGESSWWRWASRCVAYTQFINSLEAPESIRAAQR
jgi:metal transporter CNNM